MNFFRIILFGISVLVLTGCGQKGPLYMPGHPPKGYHEPPGAYIMTHKEREAEYKQSNITPYSSNTPPPY